MAQAALREFFPTLTLTLTLTVTLTLRVGKNSRSAGTGYRSVKTEPEIFFTGPSVTTAPPIKYGLGYRSRTLNPNPKTDPNPNRTLTLKVTKMYAIQNDTGITVNTEL